MRSWRNAVSMAAETRIVNSEGDELEKQRAKWAMQGRRYGRLGHDRLFRTGALRLLAPELHHQEHQGV